MPGGRVERCAPAPHEHRLCIGILTGDDLDGACLTIQAIRLYEPEVVRHASFLIVDDDPDHRSSEDVQALLDAIPRLRYLARHGGRETSPQDLIVRAAEADVVCCIDRYALLEPGTLAAILARFDEDPARRAPIHGPGFVACRRDAWAEGDPFACFDGIFCLNLDGATERWYYASRRHEQLGIAGRVERFPGVATPDNPHRGIAMAFRLMIAEAKRRRWEHLLVFEDDAVFLDDAIPIMRAVAAELETVEWDLCYLGACVWSQEFPFLGDSTVLQACGPVTCTHAIAFHRRAYDRLLAQIPTAADDLDRFLEHHYAIDQYLSHRIADGTYRAVITSPRVASQPNLLDWSDGDGALGERYVI